MDLGRWHAGRIHTLPSGSSQSECGNGLNGTESLPRPWGQIPLEKGRCFELSWVELGCCLIAQLEERKCPVEDRRPGVGGRQEIFGNRWFGVEPVMGRSLGKSALYSEAAREVPALASPPGEAGVAEPLEPNRALRLDLS